MKLSSIRNLVPRVGSLEKLKRWMILPSPKRLFGIVGGITMKLRYTIRLRTWSNYTSLQRINLGIDNWMARMTSMNSWSSSGGMYKEVS